MHYIHRIKRQYIEFIVGIFIIVAIIIVLVILFVGVKEKKVLEKKYRLSCIFSQGYQIKPGALIYLAGIEIGIVESVDFVLINNTYKIKMILSIDMKFMDKIRKNSVATIGSPALVGSRMINISMGDKRFALLKDGDTIPTKEFIEMEDIIDNLKQLALKIVQKEKQISTILNNIEEASFSLKDKKTPLGAILCDKEIYNKLHTTVCNLETTSIYLNKQLPIMLSYLENTTKELPELIINTNKTLTELETTIKILKEVSMMVNKEKDMLFVKLGQLLDNTNELLNRINAILKGTSKRK